MRGTPMQVPAISLEGVEKTCGGFELGPVDGKSTLFGILMNLIQPDSGRLSLGYSRGQ